MVGHFFICLHRVLLIASCLAVPGVAIAVENVTLQFKWSHAFQFAGYYAALEKGYYREAGIDVTFLEATPGIDPLESVLTGQAQYGVGTSSLLLARKNGKPVVVLAAIFQHSPLVLIARQDGVNGLQGIHDIVGKKIMIEPQSDELIAYLKQEGITLDRVVQLPHSFQPDDLIEGRVDAFSAYVSNEPYYLDKAKLDYQTYTPRTGGIDFYGDNLFTTEKELKEHPERARAFREASLLGWQYAMQHPEEIADLIIAKYSKQHPRDFYLFEARRMAPLIRADLVEVGYMHHGRWRHIASTYADLGLLPRNYTFDGFLYELEAHRDLRPLYLALALLVTVSAITLYIYRINRRLSLALEESRRAEECIRHLAQHDPLTNLPNRALFSDRLNQALLKAKRDGECLAVMFMDLDNLKPVNDNFGHEVGDQLLQQVACRLRENLRESDTVARLGGDEFIALLCNSRDASDVLAVGEKLAGALVTPFQIDGHWIEISASIGVAIYPNHGISDNELLKHADGAMYEAKRAGRNQTRLASV